MGIEPFRKSAFTVTHVVVASADSVQYLGRIVLNNFMYRYQASANAPGSVRGEGSG